MNRTDRLLAIVLELQAKGWQRAEDLAATFELSKRTIYRDMLALMESGVPLISSPGQGYALVEGYFLPPLSFSSDEAVILLLGADYVQQYFDEQYQKAAASASSKIQAVLPEGRRSEVADLQSSMQFVNFIEPTAPEILGLVRQSVVHRKTIRFTYHARDGEVSQREANPYALIHTNDAWMLIAHCHLRHDTRYFRLDRMEKVTVTNRIFSRPPDFKITFDTDEGRNMIARALFDHEVARRVQESPSGLQINQAEHEDGLLVTFAVRKPEDMLNWLLSWGSHVHVLEPESLRELMRQEAAKIAQIYCLIQEQESY